MRRRHFCGRADVPAAAQSHASSTRAAVILSCHAHGRAGGSSGLPKPSTYADDFLNGLQVGSAEWSKIVHGGAASTSDLGASVIGALLSLIIVFLATLSPTVHAFARSLRPPSEPMFGSRALAFVGGLHGWTQGRDDQQVRTSRLALASGLDSVRTRLV